MESFPLFRAAAIASALCVGVTPARAQSDASSMSGTVTDASGAALANAKVLVHGEATNTDRTATTNEGGTFTLPNLASGNYSVRVEAPGFQTTTLTDVRLDPSIGRRVDVSLKVGNTATEVNVEANGNAVQTESASVGQLVTEEQVKSFS